MAGKRKRKAAPGDVATNRQASFRYDVLERLECGIVLTGTEVKSLRGGRAQLKDGYASVDDGELWLHLAAHCLGLDGRRVRKLLVHRRELDRLTGSTQQRGLTLVPLRIYFSGPHAKVELALARGRERHDKREAIRAREQQREVQRALRDANR